MKFIDNLIGKGLSWWVISQLISLNLAWMVTLAAPMATLIAALMAFGSLSSSNEIVVMQSSGLSQFRLMIPVLIFAGILCYGLIMFNNKVLPEANHRTKVLMNDIQRTRPTFVIEPGKFTDDIGGYNMLVKKVTPETNKLKGIFIIDNSNPATSNILTADSGQISFSKDYSKVIVDLFSGEIHQLSKKNAINDYRKINFQQHIVSIEASGFGFNNSDQNAFSRGDRELSADSMRNIVSKIQSDFVFDKVKSTEQVQILALEFNRFNFDTTITDTNKIQQRELLKAGLMNRFIGFKTKLATQKQVLDSNQKQIDQFQVEIYKKYSIPFACIVFVLIGAPLGTITRKGGFGIAAGMSLGFFLLYWACLIGGEKLADRGFMSPLLSMWIANFILGAVGLYLTFRNSINLKSLFKKKKINN